MNYYNEWDAKKAAWLRSLINEGLISHGTVDQRSICDVRPEDLSGATRAHFFAGIAGWEESLRMAGWPAEEPVWTASLPCGPWSVAGDQAGETDERHLAPQFLSLVEQCAPSIIFGEQVASEDALFWLDGLFFRLENQGYTCAAADLCAAGVGAIHGRQRLFWGAYSDRFRVPRLESSRDSGALGQGREDREADLQSFIERPFLPGPRWPQPLLRSSDDGLSRRVAGCHAAGDAIVPQVAAQFIQAFIEAIE